MRQMRKRCLRANQECTDSLLEKLLWIDRVDWRCAVGKASSSLGRASDTDMMNIKSMLRYLRGNPGIMTVRPTTLNLEAARRALVGLVLTYGDSDWAGDADRFSKSGAALRLRGKLGWCPIASSRNKSTTALSSGETKLVAELSGACEGMGLRQRWNWLEQFGCRDDESTEASQQILYCVSSAALGMIRRKGSTGKTTHRVESVLSTTMECATGNEFCLGGNERDACRLFDEDTVDTNFGPSSKLGLEINSSPELIRTWSKRSSGGRVRKFPHIFDKFVDVFLSKFFFLIFPFSLTRITHFTMNSELTRCIQAVLLVLTKFLVVHERERCEGLRRGWFSVPQHVDCVSAFASRHWFSVVRVACDSGFAL